MFSSLPEVKTSINCWPLDGTHELSWSPFEIAVSKGNLFGERTAIKERNTKLRLEPVAKSGVTLAARLCES